MGSADCATVNVRNGAASSERRDSTPASSRVRENTSNGPAKSEPLEPPHRVGRRDGEEQRLAAAIRRTHPVSAVCAVSAREIDRINVLQATRKAMTQALETLDPPPDLALVDAVQLSLKGGAFPCLPVVRGDQISYAVACASILAKVERDQLMIELDRRYPQYGFAAHKGYGAEAHRRALVDHGPCEFHRLTFRSVLPRRTDTAAGRKAGVR